MAAENPPKLWVYLAPAAERDGAHGATGLRVFANGEERRAIEGRAIAGSYHLDGRVSPVQVYLREDIVIADVASLAATWGVLQAKHEAETAALLARVNATEAARVVLRDAVQLAEQAMRGWGKADERFVHDSLATALRDSADIIEAAAVARGSKLCTSRKWSRCASSATARPSSPVALGRAPRSAFAAAGASRGT